MKLKIVNSNNDELLIPLFKLAESSLSRRIGLSQRFGKHGGFITGDRKYSGRKSVLIGNIHAIKGISNDSEFINQYKELIEILDERFNPYFLIDTDNNRRIEFDFDRFAPSTSPGLEKISSEFRLQLIFPEVAWEDINETTEASPSGGTATGETLEVDNTGQMEAFPVITVVPSGVNTAFTLFNNTTEDLISIGSNNFVPGTKMIIDAINGTLILDDTISQTEISVAIADGTGFFTLARGQNVIEYESVFGSVDITIKYRNRHLF